MDITKYTEMLPTLDQLQNGFASLTDKGIQLEKLGSSILIGILAVSALICILGLNIRKLWAVLASLLIGFGLGYYAGLSFGMETAVALGIGAVAGIILAILSIFLNAVGAFLLCLLLAAYTGFLVVPSGQTMYYMIGLGIAVVIALISIKLKDPMTIVCTVAAGSITGGLAAMPLFGLDTGYYQYIISAVLAVIGLVSQILYASRKVAKQDIKKAKEIKAEQSVENEVEAARAILDEEETEPADEEKAIPEAEQEAEESASLEQTEPEQEELIEEAFEEDVQEEDDFAEEEFADDFEEDDFTEEDFAAEEPVEELIEEEEIIEEEAFLEEAADEDESMETEEPELSPEEEAAKAKRELEEAKKELERMKKELEEAKKEK